MTFYETVLLYFSSVGTAFLLIAGGWVKIRDWFKTKAAEKVEAAEAAKKAKADEIEAKVQERLKKLQEGTDGDPKAVATSVNGQVST